MDIDRIKEIRKIADTPGNADVYFCMILIRELCDALTDSTITCGCRDCDCEKENNDELG